MYERLLVAVDRSEVSKRVIKAAEELARRADSEVFVLHLREREVLDRLGVVPTEQEKDAQELISDAVSTLTAAGVKAHGELRETIYGRAAKEIVDSARSHDASLIVMGSRGLSDLKGLVIGSTAHKVLHLSDHPVLIVR
jgi:nucleotide-binding universal stress UspA family protein